MTAAWAAAAFGDVWIVDGKSLAGGSIDEIDGGAVEMEGHFLFGDNGNAVLFISGVGFWVELVLETEGVLQPRTTAAGNAHAEHGVWL